MLNSCLGLQEAALISTFSDESKRATIRLLVGSAAITASVVLTATGHVQEGATLFTGLLGAGAHRLIDLAEHLVAHDLHAKLTEPAEPQANLLQNRDLTRTIGRAIQLACEKITRNGVRTSRSDRRCIALIGREARKRVSEVLQGDAFLALKEWKLPRVLAGWSLQPGASTVLVAGEWDEIIHALAGGAVSFETDSILDLRQRWSSVRLFRSQRRLSASAYNHLLQHIDQAFQLALHELLKAGFERHSKDYASLEMLVWAELLTAAQTIQDVLQLHSTRVQELLSQQAEDRQLLLAASKTTEENARHRLQSLLDHIDQNDGERRRDLLSWFNRAEAWHNALAEHQREATLTTIAHVSSATQDVIRHIESRVIPEVQHILARPDQSNVLTRYGELVMRYYRRPFAPSYAYAEIEHAVPLRCQIDDQRSADLMPALLQSVTALNHPKPVLLLGEYGQGKTAACGALGYELAKLLVAKPNEGLVPVLLSLRRLRDVDQLEATLSEPPRDFHDALFDPETYRLVTSSGRTVFILDGLDELIARSPDKNLSFYVQRLHESPLLWSNRFIVTMRPNVISGTEERRELANTFKLLTIEALSILKVQEFLDRIGLSAVMTQVQFVAGHALMQLVTRPLFLSMIKGTADVLKELNSLKDLTDVDLFSYYVSQWHAREMRQLGSRLGSLSYEQIDQILSLTACRMARRNVLAVTDDELDEITRSCVDADLSSELRALQAQARERLILVPDFSDTARQFTFRHESLGSYFLARHLFRQVRNQIAKPAPLEGLEDLASAFLLGLIAKDKVLADRLNRWYRHEVAERAHLEDEWGSLFLLWAARQRLGVDIDYLKNFCDVAQDRWRRLVLTNLRGVDFTRADFSGARLSGAVLRDCPLTFARLTDVDLAGADLAGARLSGALIDNAKLQDTSFEHADLTGTIVRNLAAQNTRFGSAILANARLENVVFSEAVFAHARLSGVQLLDAQFTKTDFTSADIRNAAAVRCGWRQCLLNATMFFGTSLSGCEFVENTGEPMGLTHDGPAVR